MTQSEFVEGFAERFGLSKTVARKMFLDLAETVRVRLELDGAVDFPGLGKFVVAERAARPGRNPRTGEAVDIPASRAVKFRAAKALRDAVNQPSKPAPSRSQERRVAVTRAGPPTARSAA